MRRLIVLNRIASKTSALYAVNWAAARFADAIPRSWVRGLALAAGATAWAAGTAGAIQFLVEKPWF